MGWIIWLIVGIILVGAMLFFSIRNSLDRRARQMRGSDPERAAALRNIRGQINRGGMYR